MADQPAIMFDNIDEGLVLQRRRRRGGGQALALGLGQREPLGLRMALLLELLAGRMVVLPRPRFGRRMEASGSSI